MRPQPLRFDAWLQLVADRPLAILDLETTDADAKECGVCELGVVAYSGEKIAAAVTANIAAWSVWFDAATAADQVGAPHPPTRPAFILPEPDWQFSTRINPGRPIHPGATRVHGIKDEDVIGLAGIESVLPQLQHIAENYTVAGYNLDRFDLTVLRRHGIDPPHVLEIMGTWLALGDRSVAWYSDDEREAWRVMGEAAAAEMDLAKRRAFVDGFTLPPRVVGDMLCKLGGDVFKDKLGAAHAALYGYKLEGAHGALADCLGTAAVLFGGVALQTDLPTDLPTLAQLSLEMVGFIRPGPAGPYYTRGRNAGETVVNVHMLDPGYVRWTLFEAEIRDCERLLIQTAIGPDAYTALINAATKAPRGRRPRAAATS